MSVEDQLRIRKLRQKLFGDKRSFSLNSASPADQYHDQELSSNKKCENEPSIYHNQWSQEYGDIGDRDFRPKLTNHYERIESNAPTTATSTIPTFDRRSSRQDTASNVENWIYQSATTAATRKPLLFNYKEKFSDKGFRAISEPDLTVRLRRMACGSSMFQTAKLQNAEKLLQQQRSGSGTGSRYVIAMYDYNPIHESPNPSGPNDELSFRKGSLILIRGDVDQDGFYYGELDGRRGLVPSNLVVDSEFSMYNDFNNWPSKVNKLPGQIGRQYSRNSGMGGESSSASSAASTATGPRQPQQPQSYYSSYCSNNSLQNQQHSPVLNRGAPAGPSSYAMFERDQANFYRSARLKHIIRQNEDLDRWGRNSSDPLLTRANYTPPEYHDSRFAPGVRTSNPFHQDRMSICSDTAGPFAGGFVGGGRRRRQQQFGQKSMSLDIDPDNDDSMYDHHHGPLISSGGNDHFGPPRRISYAAMVSNGVPYNSPLMMKKAPSRHDPAYEGLRQVVMNESALAYDQTPAVHSLRNQDIHHGSLPRLNSGGGNSAPKMAHVQNFRQMSLSHDEDYNRNEGCQRYSEDSPRRARITHYGSKDYLTEEMTNRMTTSGGYYPVEHSSSDVHRYTIDQQLRSMPVRESRHRRSFRKDGRDALQRNMKKMIDDTTTPRKVIAKFNYDPCKDSPNVTAQFDELKFKIGDIITIYGDMDEDGFFVGQLEGRVGLVPSNFLHLDAIFEPAQVDIPIKKTLPRTPVAPAPAPDAVEPPARKTAEATPPPTAALVKPPVPKASTAAGAAAGPKKSTAAKNSAGGATAAERRAKTMKKAESVAVGATARTKKQSTADSAPLKKMSSVTKSATSLTKKS